MGAYRAVEMIGDYDIDLAAKMSVGYSDAYFDYFIPYGVVNKSFSLTLGDGKLLCPVLDLNGEIGGGRLSLLPVPAVVGEVGKKTISRLYGDYVDVVSSEAKVITLRVDPIVGIDSDLLCCFLKDGFGIQNQFTTVIDLNNELDVLWGRLRTRFKGQINGFNKLCDIKVLCGSEQGFEEWIALYSFLTSRGGATPPDAVFDKMRSTILSGKAALFLAYQAGTLVAGIYVMFTRGAAYYFSGGVNPDYEKKAAYTHGLFWAAFKFLKSVGVRCFEVGPIDFPQLGKPVSDKILDISDFKMGLGGRLVSNLILKKEF